MRATIKIFVSGIFLKKNKHNLSKPKTILLSFRKLSFYKYFLNKNIFVLTKFIFSFRKHFHFCLQIKIFSFQKLKQFYFHFANVF